MGQVHFITTPLAIQSKENYEKNPERQGGLWIYIKICGDKKINLSKEFPQESYKHTAHTTLI